jgi:hypothetical protein
MTNNNNVKDVTIGNLQPSLKAINNIAIDAVQRLNGSGVTLLVTLRYSPSKSEMVRVQCDGRAPPGVESAA